MKQRTKLYILPLITLSLVLTLGLAVYRTVHAADNNLTDGITVDSTLDTADASVGDGNCDDGDGNCTLRAAIQEANSDPDVSTIEFNIAPFDGSVKTISATSPLPEITSQLTIDGYSQDTAEPNTAIAPSPLNGTLLVELNGENLAPDGTPGLSLGEGSGYSVIKGLVINRSPGGGIVVNNGADHVSIQGNYIGTDATGLLDRGNSGTGVSTSFVDNGPDYGLVGGLNPEDRNVISANSMHLNDPNQIAGAQGLGIGLWSDHWTLQGNYVGLGADGITALGNELGGITIDYVDGMLIGGTEEGATNVFSANGDGGVQPDGVHQFVMKGNYIGTDYTGANPVPNGTKGMSIAYGSTDGMIGGTEPGAGNIIAFSNWVGISVWLDETKDISILGNSIHDNTLAAIELGDGSNTNDSLDADEGANDLLNYPENLKYNESVGDTQMSFDLDVPAGDYRIEFFSNTVADISGWRGEGETFIGFQNITSNGTGVQAFSATLSGTSLPNITATVTEIDDSSDGFGPTSEFSDTAEQLPPPPDFIDLSVSKTLTDPENVNPGGTIHYNLSVTNLGYTPADISVLDGGGGGNPFQSVFLDFLPPELTFVSSSNPDITCTDAGTTITGLIAANHTDWHAIACFYTGGGEILEENETFSTTFEVTVANDSDLVFTNYAVGGLLPEDPDSGSMSSALNDSFGNGGDPDFIDTMIDLSANNFAAAIFPIPVEQETSGGSSNSSNSQGLLGGTGENILFTATATLVTLSLSIFSVTKVRKQNRR